jgi:hypothetical protein
MERIGESVRRAVSGTALPDVGALAAITHAWPAAVGEPIARSAWPARIARDGTLHVATASSTWAFELAGLQERILERLREEVGEDAPQSLRFAPGPVPEPSAATPETRPSTAVSATAEERSEAAALAAAIEDAELRETVARAAAASLARRRSGRAF